MNDILKFIFLILLVVVGMTLSINNSTYARATKYLKEDLEIAIHDASLQLNEEYLSEGKLVIDDDKALQEFKHSFELNTGLSPSEYTVLEFEVFDEQNSTFPLTYRSSTYQFEDIFTGPTVYAIVETSTTGYFFSSEPKVIRKATSYSYKRKQPIELPNNVPSTPNEYGLHWPVPYTNNITSHFNPARVNPVTGIVEAHNGIDIASSGVFGQPVIAVSDGRVIYSGSLGSYGNLVIISHDNGLETRYAHLNSILVSNGQEVTGGQTIGTVGTTGVSTGAHLHFEIRVNGVPYDPLTFY